MQAKIYVDGSCFKNYSLSSSFVVVSKKKIQYMHICSTQQKLQQHYSSIFSEAYAILLALNYIINNISHFKNGVTIYGDCMYIIEACNKTNNVYKHKATFFHIYNLIDDIRKHISLFFVHIKAHQKEKNYNTVADNLAKFGLDVIRQQEYKSRR